MWFKKKSVLLAEGHYNTEYSTENGADLRRTYRSYTNSNSSSIYNSGLPSAADVGNYFYLPALGYYGFGQLSGAGVSGYYWSSSASSWDGDQAYYLHFNSSSIAVDLNVRNRGYRVESLQ